MIRSAAEASEKGSASVDDGPRGAASAPDSPSPIVYGSPTGRAFPSPWGAPHPPRFYVVGAGTQVMILDSDYNHRVVYSEISGRPPAKQLYKIRYRAARECARLNREDSDG